MSGSGYKRTTKKFAARIDHVDGDTSEGFVLVPVGTDFLTTLTQTAGFLHFQMQSGEETYLNILAIKRVTELADRTAEAAEAEAEAKRASEAKAKAEADRAAAEQRKRDTARKNAQQSGSVFQKDEELDALDVLGLGDKASLEDIQNTYRRLVKLYHPDRLRGLGLSDEKIAYAAEKLAEINNAYRLLAKASKAA